MPDAAEITVPPEVLQTVKEALSQTIGATAPSGGSDIRVMAAPTAENGFTLTITYGGNVYGVTFGMPTGTETVWSVSITMKLGAADPVTLLAFTYDTSKGTWHLLITSPKVTIGSVTINAITIDIGSTTTTPT